MNLHSWTPATDTTELRYDLRGPYWNATTVEIPLIALRPEVTPTRRRPLSMPAFLARLVRMTASFVAVLLFLLALSATPADARPVLDDPDAGYLGPITSAHFAGLSASVAVAR